MTLTPRRGGIIILFTFCIALLLMILPLPEEVRLYRPQWVVLVLIYWTIALPERIGITTAFSAGIALDVLTGTLLGQHALALSLVGYLTYKVHLQVRQFPLWQQSLSVLILLFVAHALTLLINGAIGRLPPPSPLTHLGAPLIGALLWPWLYIILRDTRRRFRVR